MKNFISRILTILIPLLSLLSFSHEADCQELENREFNNILIDSHVRVVDCVAQDATGLIWLGTDAGLFSFDGYSAQKGVYADGVSVPSTINCMKAIGKYLYIGTDNGLDIYDTKKDCYVKANVKFPNNVRALEIRNGELWIGTLNGLYRYGLKSNLLKMVSTGLPHKTIYSIMRTASNVLYVGTYNGLCKYDDKKNAFTKIVINRNPHRNNLFVNSLLEDRSRGVIWIGTEGDLIKFNPKTGESAMVNQFTDNSVKSIAKDASHNLIIGTDNGLFIWNERMTKHFEHDSRKSSSISNNIIWNVFVDKENNVWLGTESGVSLLYNNSKFRFVPISELTGQGTGNTFYTIRRDSRGYLWLGGTNGLLQVNEAGNDVKWYSMGNPQYPLPHNRIRDIYEDSNQNLWIATDGSVNRYDYTSRRFVHYLITNSSHTLNANWAYDIFEDKNNNLWIATFLGGLFMVNRDALIANPAGINVARNVTIGESCNVNQLVPKKDGGAWATLYGSSEGLCKIDASGKIKRIDLQQYGVTNYPSILVVDSFGNLWGGYNGGVFILSNEEKLLADIKFGKYSSGDVLSMCQVDGNMWVSTTEDIWSIGLKNRIAHRLAIPDKSYTCLYYDKKYNNVILGANDGYMNVSSNIEEYKNLRNNIIITSINVNDKPITFDDCSVREINNFELEYNQNHIVVRFSDLNYVANSRNRFVYRIENVDKKWTLLPENDNVISYANLTPGNYSLQICGLGNDGEPSGDYKTLSFRICPPWYYSTFSKLIYALIAIGMITWVINFFRVKNRLKIERMDREKTLEQVKAKMDFFTNISHEFKTPLSMIIGPVGKMLSEMKESGVTKNLKIVQQNAMKLNSLIHSALEFERIDDNSDNLLIISRVEVVNMCRSIFEAFKESNDRKHFTFNSIVDEIYMDIDAIKMESVISNILSNACKYSPEDATISFSVNELTDKVVFSISDNGIGIPQNEMPFIFQRLYQSSRTSGNKEGTGIGLYLAKTYVKMHKGDISVADNNGDGTVFTITLPYEPDAYADNHVQAEASINSQKKTILIVDDNVAITDFIKDLMSEKYNCLTAINGRAGLDICETFVPDAIIVDVMMPVMNGIDMSKALKKSTKLSSIPIIMLTAKGDTGTEAESVELGIDVFMPKPFDPVILKSRIGQLIKAKDKLRTQVRIEELTSVKKIEAESVDEKLLAEIIKVIEDNISDPELNVNFVCEKTNINSKQLYRKVKQHIGVTPVEYIKQIRIKKAAMLIQQHKFSISEVMYMVGFSSSSYFSKCFQSQFGKTPRQYNEEM